MEPIGPCYTVSGPYLTAKKSLSHGTFPICTFPILQDGDHCSKERLPMHMQLSHNILSNLTCKVPSFVETEPFLLFTYLYTLGEVASPRVRAFPKFHIPIWPQILRMFLTHRLYEVDLMINLNICNSQGVGGKSFETYSLRVGRSCKYN